MHKLHIATAVCSILIGGNVVAQEAASINMGGFDFYPSLGFGFGHDSNVTRAESNEIESWKSTIVPEFVLSNTYGLNEVQAGYRLTRGDYFSSPADDYTDHLLYADANLDLNVRNRLSLSGQYNDGHDDRGTSFSIGQGDSLTSPDTFKNTSLSGVYSYGALTSKGRIDVSAGYATTDYDIETDAYRSRDFDTLSLGSTFYYQVMPATDLTFDVIYNDISYDFALDPTAPLDSEETRLLVGLQWESTAQTTGYVKLGNREKDFKAEGRENFSGFDWTLGVTWTPLTYSTVDISAFTNTNETNGEGDFIQTDTYLVTWDHQWLDRVSTTVRTSYAVDEYTGGTDRKDDNMAFGVSLNYQAQRYMLLQLGYDYDERDSNRNTIDYDRNVVSLSVSLTL